MKLKTSTLTRAQLDMAVALAEGLRIGAVEGYPRAIGVMVGGFLKFISGCSAIDLLRHGSYWPSRDWSVAGPIIDRERISIKQGKDGVCYAYFDHANATASGSTALEAAMRAYVAAKLGEEVEVPE